MMSTPNGTFNDPEVRYLWKPSHDSEYSPAAAALDKFLYWCDSLVREGKLDYATHKKVRELSAKNHSGRGG